MATHLNNKLGRIVFSVDDVDDLHSYARALRSLDELRAVGKLKECVMCVGSYEGAIEPRFMVLAKDFEDHIRGAWYISEQESILRIPGDVRQPCVLEYLSGGLRLTLGKMRESQDIRGADGWTYVIESGKYYQS